VIDSQQPIAVIGDRRAGCEGQKDGTEQE